MDGLALHHYVFYYQIGFSLLFYSRSVLGGLTRDLVDGAFFADVRFGRTRIGGGSATVAGWLSLLGFGDRSTKFVEWTLLLLVFFALLLEGVAPNTCRTVRSGN